MHVAKKGKGLFQVTFELSADLAVERPVGNI
jgi:hypothetical protein